MGGSQRDSGKQAVSMLAVAFVMIAGLVACLFIIISTVDQPQFPLIGCFSAFCLAGVFLWWLASDQESPAQQQYGWLRRRKLKRTRVKHRVKFNRRPAGVSSAPQPPSVESIREIKQRHSTWVPAGGPSRRRL